MPSARVGWGWWRGNQMIHGAAMKTLRLRPCSMDPSNVETASSTEAASANSKNAYLVPGV